MNKLLQIAGALALAFPVASYAGNSISFDPDGAGGMSAVSVDLFDWAAGNAVATGGASVATGGTTNLLYQANLGLTSLLGNTVTASGVGGTSFITAVAGFQEIATVTNGGLTANFALTGVPVNGLPSATNFFYIYANSVGNGDNLAGTGFTNGTIILSGYISSMNSSNFNISTVGGLPVIDQFDKANDDDYDPNGALPGTTQTLVGSGATDLTVTITGANSSYFPSLDFTGLNFSFFNTSQVTPFNQVDPSRLFNSDGLGVVPDFAPIIGSVNGIGNRGTGGVDFQFQADANQSFETTVPEPGSLALAGLALAGLGFAGRRRKV